MPISPQRHRQAERHKQLIKPLAARDIADHPTMQEFCKEHSTTYSTCKKVRATREYRDACASFTRRQAKLLGDDFKQITIEVKGKLREGANRAIQLLIDVVNDEGEKTPQRLAAATELIDRDGRFAKVSRQMNVKEGADGAPMLPEDAAAEMLDALKSARLNRESVN